jgi:hypothetical protein
MAQNCFFFVWLVNWALGLPTSELGPRTTALRIMVTRFKAESTSVEGNK